MADLKICRICLKTEVKTYTFEKYFLKSYYEEIMGHKVDIKDELPQVFCYECAALLYKFHKFKEKCHYGQNVLSEISWVGPITYEKVAKIYLSDDYLTPYLSLMNGNNGNVKTCIVRKKNETPKHRNEIEFVADNDSDDFPLKKIAKTEVEDSFENIDEVWDSEAFISIRQEEEIFLDKCDSPNNDKTECDIPIINKTECDSPIIDRTECESPIIVSTEFESPIIEKTECDIPNDNETNCDSPINILIDENKKALNIEAIELNLTNEKPKKRKKFQKNPQAKTFDMTKWKKYHLTEEEAMAQFEAKAQEKYYKKAAYKCNECLRGFSTESMFKRHKKKRHDKSIGDFECRFCKMRFDLACSMRKHMRVHFIRYECLQCQMVMFETSAILHDEFHRGVTRTCSYCGEEFKHQSTYYSHLRTHRSSYVCTLCGSSFVSKLGLNNHKKIKHVLNEVESASDDETLQVNTFCRKCDITFDTRKAYEEHLFHSVMHAEGNEDDIVCEDLAEKKILGKKLKEEICTKLRINKGVTTLLEKAKSRKTRGRKTLTKPTTCHQCGKKFDTQADCMKHHKKEHPGTSFFDSGQRHVCEICGASLAPGSLKMHENIHTRKKVHPCEICGKEFHSQIGLKRHSVTHTGEKPFACTLCDKRFTQSNSMKLHFRTFHLKEPYPKRNRQKKKDEALGIPEELSKSSEHSGRLVRTRIQDDDMDYLTLN